MELCSVYSFLAPWLLLFRIVLGKSAMFCMYQQFVHFIAEYCSIIWVMPQFIYLFACWCISGLFPDGAFHIKLLEMNIQMNISRSGMAEWYGGGGLIANSCPTLMTPWIVTRQAPPSMGFSRQVYWSGLPFPFPGDIPNPGIEPGSPMLQADSLPTELQYGRYLLIFKKLPNCFPKQL